MSMCHTERSEETAGQWLWCNLIVLILRRFAPQNEPGTTVPAACVMNGCHPERTRGAGDGARRRASLRWIRSRFSPACCSRLSLTSEDCASSLHVAHPWIWTVRHGSEARHSPRGRHCRTWFPALADSSSRIRRIVVIAFSLCRMLVWLSANPNVPRDWSWAS